MPRFLKQLGLISLIIISGTVIDWIIHSSVEQFHVEPEYYLGKILFGIVWGLIALWALKRVARVSNPKILAIGVPALVALFLQTKYFYQGRDNFFVFLFLFLHFLMFLPGSFWVFKKYPKVLVGDATPGSTRWSLFAALIILTEIAFFAYFTWIIGYHRF